jgi:putative FmdB family regulatory protein
MPTYDYECKTCGERFEVFQSIKASPLRRAECEACGTVRPVRRLVGTGGAILFKGSGFYETDYRSEGYKKAAKADRAPSTDGDKAGDKSDDKGRSTDGGKSAPTSGGEKTDKVDSRGTGGRACSK